MAFHNPLNIYFIILGGTLLLMSLYRLYIIFSRSFAWRIRFFLFKYCFYPLVFGKRSRAWVFFQLIYWSGTFLCDFLATHGLRDIGNRAANIAIVNLILLVISGRPALIADILGISLFSYIEIYRTVACMALVQAAIHIGVSVHAAGWHPKTSLQIYGLLVGKDLMNCNPLTIIYRRHREWLSALLIHLRGSGYSEYYL
jgi:hypothetical protein